MAINKFSGSTEFSSVIQTLHWKRCHQSGLFSQPGWQVSVIPLNPGASCDYTWEAVTLRPGAFCCEIYLAPPYNYSGTKDDRNAVVRTEIGSIHATEEREEVIISESCHCHVDSFGAPLTLCTMPAIWILTTTSRINGLFNAISKEMEHVQLNTM